MNCSRPEALAWCLHSRYNVNYHMQQDVERCFDGASTNDGRLFNPSECMVVDGTFAWHLVARLIRERWNAWHPLIRVRFGLIMTATLDCEQIFRLPSKLP